MYGYGSSCDVFLIRRLLAATIGTVHGLSVDVFAFQFYHASVYQSIEETSHTHNLALVFFSGKVYYNTRDQERISKI